MRLSTVSSFVKVYSISVRSMGGEMGVVVVVGEAGSGVGVIELNEPITCWDSGI